MTNEHKDILEHVGDDGEFIYPIDEYLDTDRMYQSDFKYPTRGHNYEYKYVPYHGESKQPELLSSKTLGLLLFVMLTGIPGLVILLFFKQVRSITNSDRSSNSIFDSSGMVMLIGLYIFAMLACQLILGVI